MSSSNLTYVSLFSSAGIGCHRLKELNFNCIATAELIEKRLEIQKYNKKCKYENGYISGDLSTENIQKKLIDVFEYYKAKEKIKDLDLLIATPPCQGISLVNHKKNNELKRNSLIIESIKLIKILNPRFFIFENVARFLQTLCTDIDNLDKSILEAIEKNLSDKYDFDSKVINLKNYGSNSSRTRCVVIGVRKDQKEITPLDLFPDLTPEKTLKSLIGHLPSLTKMGEICDTDILHSFRVYSSHMRSWIQNIKEGESAFDNIEDYNKPHQIINGNRVINQNKNGDKYKRQVWNKVAPCIHTRNDILASQNTIHPTDDRVFSIRELMIMMNVPDNFKWHNNSLDELNGLTVCKKEKWLEKNNILIRQCLGEAVPSNLFFDIANKINNLVSFKELKKNDILKLITEEHLYNTDNLIAFIQKNQTFNIATILKIAELSNAHRTQNAAFYTSQDICFSLIKDLPNFKSKEHIKILEPSVGCGNFIPLLAKKYQDKRLIEIDAVDIDADSLKILNVIFKKYNISNLKINLIHSDFLLNNLNTNYDLCIGNPPFKKIIGDKKLLDAYKQDVVNKNTNNIFCFFIEKCLKVSDYTSLIIPKSFLNSPEYSLTRNILKNYSIQVINDYNEKAFDVKIETISFISYNKKFKNTNLMKINSYLLNNYHYIEQDIVTENEFDTWLIYRNDFFDDLSKKIKFDVFDVFRDRQITSNLLSETGDIRLLKSRNIDNNKIIEQKNDLFINHYNHLAVSKFLNKENIVAVPNLTYNPRAIFLPSNCLVDGSVALLTPKIPVTENDLSFYATKTFRDFYKIARNYGTRSLNIDKNSVKFFGILKKERQEC